MDEKIIQFIKQMNLLTLGVINEGVPYLSSCFYAYDEEKNSLFIASSKDSTHIKAISNLDKVAICIALDTKIIGMIKGVQASGVISLGDIKAKTAYFKRFPYALPLNPDIYEIKLSWVKYTDNALGFGKKLYWLKDQI
ncbi:pyridoxamine 5'-phosphate oxidase family protein [Campylobacter hyointestinalis]|uniref:Protein YhbP n=1 Tax=Campylobacter hyointestinalis subsp. lawsonii TaxID=91353 RepID=A0AAV6EIL3_CAMHY|nr:pyridoxamine 5'-phosphate oxidase family protein [Campylobacter hyointestinalis]KAB0613291.1 hypothetical protein F7P66_04760 [Campylobacter hyointestinalis subsp. lawsonii]QKF69116.1 YhbP domain-containing protein [Campylobacter hyointestinalis subsp. lawsonii]RAZ25729.1 hypothetical protein CHL9752_02475 [Campylobacter hyointestinalis subsp. lawsonii]RAZ28376.1 hypothetical protein CHLT_04555 [Campylobacter hyointestinalis subsp. lawsonii]RAZ40183.1 hypothetical protein CHL9426_00865 [Cam